MIYRIRLTNPNDAGFAQEYVLPAESTFDAFRRLLQEELSLEQAHLVSFNVKGPHGEHGMELTMLDIEEEEPGYPVVPMGEIRLMDILIAVGDQILFTYDLLRNEALDVELVCVDSTVGIGGSGKCVLRMGTPPSILQDEFVLASQGDIESLLDDIASAPDASY